MNTTEKRAIETRYINRLRSYLHRQAVEQINAIYKGFAPTKWCFSLPEGDQLKVTYLWSKPREGDQELDNLRVTMYPHWIQPLDPNIPGVYLRGTWLIEMDMANGAQYGYAGSIDIDFANHTELENITELLIAISLIRKE
jgi:hypothetical protein